MGRGEGLLGRQTMNYIRPQYGTSILHSNTQKDFNDSFNNVQLIDKMEGKISMYTFARHRKQV